MQPPAYLQRLLRICHPGTKLYWHHAAGRFILTWKNPLDGHLKLLRILQTSRREFVWPNPLNTIAWLTAHDTAHLLNQWRRNAWISRELDEPRAAVERAEDARRSDYVRGELAPRLKRVVRKIAWS